MPLLCPAKEYKGCLPARSGWGQQANAAGVTRSVNVQAGQGQGRAVGGENVISAVAEFFRPPLFSRAGQAHPSLEPRGEQQIRPRRSPAFHEAATAARCTDTTGAATSLRNFMQLVPSWSGGRIAGASRAHPHRVIQCRARPGQARPPHPRTLSNKLNRARLFGIRKYAEIQGEGAGAYIRTN